VLAGVAILITASCSTPKESPRRVDIDAELRQEMERYAELVRKMDNPGIAGLFTDDGAIVNGAQMVSGPKAIQDFLDKFKQYQVQTETLTVQSVHGSSSAAQVLGTYDQTVRLPAGNVVEARGNYSADWVRGGDGKWRLKRMATFGGQQAPAGSQ